LATKITKNHKVFPLVIFVFFVANLGVLRTPVFAAITLLTVKEGSGRARPDANLWFLRFSRADEAEPRSREWNNNRVCPTA
jgi:hypothetical protein